MIKINNLSLDFGGNILFNNISLQIKNTDKIGLIGKNGSGKTTLLNLISHKINPTKGNIVHNNNIKIAYLPQELSFNPNINLKDFVIGNNSEHKELDNKINDINNSLTNIKSEKIQFNLLDELDQLQHKKDQINLLKLEINAEKIMKGLGFIDSDFKKNINILSGGWKMRAELSRLLVLDPNILLLDEPTNHLDLPAIIWLEKFLTSTQCVLMLVSHDIKFLDKNINRVLEISQNKIKDFKGNYSKYIIHRDQEIEQQIREKKNQDKYIKQAHKLINKFRYKKNKAAFAQTLIKRIKKMELIEIDNFDISTIHFQFPDPLHCGKIIFQSDGLSKSFEDKNIFKNLDLDIYKGDRIAFVGKNGCGKTTLTKIINGDLDFNGNVKKGEKVKINYFAQNQNELLDPDLSIIEYIERTESNKTNTQLRGLLGAFLFSGNSIYKKIKVLSGGEKARLSLCALLLSPSNVIILDEPTNHLDIFAKEILKQALIQYNGTLIVVSHDRNFLSGLTDRVIEFDENKIREYPGNIDSYLEQQDVVLQIPTKKETKNVILYKQKKEFDKQLRLLNKQNDNFEKEITKIEKEITKFKFLLNEINNITTNDKIDYNEYNRLNDLLKNKMELWEKNQTKIENVIQKRDLLLHNKK